MSSLITKIIKKEFKMKINFSFFNNKNKKEEN